MTRLCIGMLAIGIAAFLFNVCQELWDSSQGGGYAAYGLVVLLPAGFLMVVFGLVGSYQCFRGCLQLAAGDGLGEVLAARDRRPAHEGRDHPASVMHPHLPVAEMRWHHAGSLALGCATLPDGRCWMVLRGADRFFCARETDAGAAGEHEFLLAQEHHRIPNAWMLAPELAKIVFVAFVTQGAMPDGVEWLSTSLPVDHGAHGPWQWWSEAAKQATPVTVVPKRWLYRMASRAGDASS